MRKFEVKMEVLEILFQFYLRLHLAPHPHPRLGSALFLSCFLSSSNIYHVSACILLTVPHPPPWECRPWGLGPCYGLRKSQKQPQRDLALSSYLLDKWINEVLPFLTQLLHRRGVHSRLTAVLCGQQRAESTWTPMDSGRFLLHTESRLLGCH